VCVCVIDNCVALSLALLSLSSSLSPSIAVSLFSLVCPFEILSVPVVALLALCALSRIMIPVVYISMCPSVDCCCCCVCVCVCVCVCRIAVLLFSLFSHPLSVALSLCAHAYIDIASYSM
jgi:hypothetical protein